ncbi:hypothetical protein KSF_045680 [Reticulibacter mediterranei]|uniref:Uncharacterized protein n=1 Tax=Reticulibacter mediterranei TaxID=2778369 RepID=A0A8J3IL95_9CHLR|nr:hypothetical protein [Reticulibacter mediterranei]GHO94520.1 hypothetical protein KSF_045680 [Reticulibacter mediterranei]
MLTKPRDPAKSLNTTIYTRKRRKRMSPLMLIGLSIPIILALIAGTVFIQTFIASHAAAADPNPNCTLLVPANPLTAQGLATPYQLVATDPAQGPCNEANIAQSAFVQADIIDPATGQITTYNPLVIDQGTQPAVAPTVPTLPARAVVGIWFGFNGDTIKILKNNAKTGGKATTKTRRSQVRLGGNMANGNCVNGVANSPFGQFAYCNAPAFFTAANRAIQAGNLTVPAIGMAKDGQACPTTRDFSLVDMDQADNVQTQYLVNANGQTAQNTAANKAQLANATVIANPSDNALLTAFVAPALGCQSWTVPDIADNNNMVATFATDELQAAAHQQAPVALVPANDPMVLNNGNQDLNKVNAYRRGANQKPAASLNAASGTTYCQNLVNINPTRLQLDMQIFQALPSPDGGATANNMFTFLANRLSASLGADGLNCVGLLKIQNPITLTTDANGVVTAATINQPNGNNGNGQNPVPTPTTPANQGGNNGGVTQAVQGTAKFNLEANERSVGVQLNITYPNHPDQAVNVQVRTDSCTGKVIFTQREDLDDNGANNADTVINNVQGVTLPGNWFFTVADTKMQNATVGCGSVVANGNGQTATATLGTVLPVPANGGNGVPAVSAQGNATFNLDTMEHSVEIMQNVTYTQRPNEAVNIQVRTNSCTGNVIFNHREDLNAQGMNDDDTNINGVQGTALPTNWFFAVVDPQTPNANGQPTLIGCGAITASGTMGTATLAPIQ